MFIKSCSIHKLRKLVNASFQRTFTVTQSANSITENAATPSKESRGISPAKSQEVEDSCLYIPYVKAIMIIRGSAICRCGSCKQYPFTSLYEKSRWCFIQVAYFDQCIGLCELKIKINDLELIHWFIAPIQMARNSFECAACLHCWRVCAWIEWDCEKEIEWG